MSNELVNVPGSVQVMGLIGTICAVILSSALNHSFWWEFFISVWVGFM